MNRNELLTRLAMEMAEWPSGLNRYQLDKIVSPIIPLDYYQGSVDDWGKSEAYLLGWNITRYDWIAKRERLINKPTWERVLSAAPWAEYLVQTGDGWWHAFDAYPRIYLATWLMGEAGKISQGICKGAIPAGHDWRDTLEQRPAEWPIEDRIEAIGQNGPSGDHYGDEAFRECERRLREAELTRHIATEPMPKAWSGEGMPPIGTVCEAKVSPGEWLEGEVLAHYRPNAGGPEVAVFAYRRTSTSDNRHVDQLIPEFFRPIRSDEDKQIDAMKSAASISYVKPEYMEMICRALYRAGYRKPGGDV